MKKLFPILLLNSLLFLSSCSVYLENEGENYNDGYYSKYFDTDTLFFHTPKSSIKIDSARVGDEIYRINATRFNLPIQIIGFGQQSLDVKLFLSNGKQKRISKDLIVMSSVSPVEIKVQDFIEISHDKRFYTQGLEFYKGILYESAGLYRHSSVNQIDRNTGEVVSTLNIDNSLFAEGFTFVDDTIYMLTWKEKQLLKFDNQLKLISQLDYPREGWGLCWKGNELVASDGSQKLYFIDHHDLSLKREQQVYDDKGVVKQLNELEWVEGYIWANVYGHSYIAVIDPESGKVLYRINFDDIIAERNLWSKGVFNGIAYDNGQVYLTGKNWPYYFVWTLPDELKKDRP